MKKLLLILFAFLSFCSFGQIVLTDDSPAHTLEVVTTSTSNIDYLIEFFDEVSAQLATVKLKDTFIDKRRINVSLSKEKKPKPITPSSELSEQGVDTASVAPVAEQEAPNE